MSVELLAFQQRVQTLYKQPTRIGPSVLIFFLHEKKDKVFETDVSH